ncbi:MAG TPA: IS1595 family transposase [Dehalococcoidia bacterium]|nr:IS1595 family transposase [Dehalococcoidia bacterium]
MKEIKQQRYSINDFNNQFPNDDACLEWLKNIRYPDGIHCSKCNKITSHYKVTGRPCYVCDICGHHVYPMAGTILEKSATSIRLWFYAIFIMSNTRCGVSAKELQRQLRVTYKTAWRMFKQIRSMLNEDIMTLLNEVEIDETYVGGKHHGKRGRGSENKTPVFGMTERKGDVIAMVVPDVKSKTIIPAIKEKVLSKSIIYTDEFPTYNQLPRLGYQHKRVHHAQKIYVAGEAHTNTIEGFWSLVKRGISGANHAISAKYLQGYLNAYAFRWNHRSDDSPMFLQMLSRLSSLKV